MAIIVKCHSFEPGSDGVVAVDAAWVYENCLLEQGDEVFVWWHKSRAQPGGLQMRGRLLQFSHLDKSPTTGHPEASLQVDVTGRILRNRRLVITDLNENSETPALRTLWRKLKGNSHTKITFSDPMETDYLQSFFHCTQNSGC